MFLNRFQFQQNEYRFIFQKAEVAAVVWWARWSGRSHRRRTVTRKPKTRCRWRRRGVRPAKRPRNPANSLENCPKRSDWKTNRQRHCLSARFWRRRTTIWTPMECTRRTTDRRRRAGIRGEYGLQLEKNPFFSIISQSKSN